MPTSIAPPVFVPNEIPTAGVAPEQVPGFVCLGSMVSYTDIDGGTGQGVVLKMVADDPTREGGVSGWLLEVQPDGGTGTVMVMPSEAVLIGEDVAVVPMEVSVKKRTVARGRGTATFPRGAPIRGEGGRFGGSEPGEVSDDAGGGESGGGGDSGGGDNPFTGGDRMADVLPASGDQFVDEIEAAAVAEVIAAGGDIFNAAGGDADMTSEDRESIIRTNDEVEAAMQPAPAGVEIYTTAFVTDRYTLDPETGSVTRDSRGTTVDALQSAGSSVEGAPQFTVGSGDPASALKFAGEGTYVYGRPDGSLGRMEGQRVPIKVTVPEGHPMVNAGRDNDVNPDSDTNVVLSRDTSLTVTGFGVDAETGAAMFTAEATLRPSRA